MIWISWSLALIALVSIPISIAVTAVIAKRSQKLFIAAVAQHRRAQRHRRGDLHRPRPRQGLRPPEGDRRQLQGEERRALRGGLRGAVHQRHHHAGHDVRREPQLRRHRRRRRPAGRERHDEPRRRAGVHPVLPAVHPAADAGGLDGQRAPVGRRVRGAGLRGARRARAGGRPRGRRCASTTRTAPSPSRTSRSPTCPRSRSSRTSTCRSARVRPWRSSGRPAPARRRSSTSSCGSTSSTPAASRSTASTSATSPAHDLRARIGMVLQDTWLFGGTIRDNIAYGRPGATEEEVLEAAPRDLRRPLRALAARRLRHGARRRGVQHLGRREAARHHRARLPVRPGAAHPRRGDELGRHAHRAARAARHGGAALRPHELRHRAPPVDDP